MVLPPLRVPVGFRGIALRSPTLLSPRGIAVLGRGRGRGGELSSPRSFSFFSISSGKLNPCEIRLIDGLFLLVADLMFEWKPDKISTPPYAINAGNWASLVPGALPSQVFDCPQCTCV